MTQPYLQASRRALFSVLALGALSQCSVREQVQEAPSVPAVRFSLVQIDEATFDGFDVIKWRTPNDVSLEQRTQLIKSYVNGNLHLRMRLLLDARNPTQTASTLSKLEYEVRIDDKPLGTGQLTPALTLPTDGSTVQLPLTFTFNTMEMLGPDALPKLRNYALGLADTRRKPLRLSMRLRPTLSAADGATTVGRFSPLETDSVRVAAAPPVVAP